MQFSKTMRYEGHVEEAVVAAAGVADRVDETHLFLFFGALVRCASVEMDTIQLDFFSLS